MAYVEVKKIYEVARLPYGNNFLYFPLIHWKRYLEGVFILWPHGLIQILKFMNLNNNINLNIQLWIEYSGKYVLSLDILVMKKAHLETNMHFKPTGSNLLFSSFYPKPTNTKIPFNLARSICTIVSNFQIRRKRLQKRANTLLERQYTNELIHHEREYKKKINHQILR